MHLFAFLLHIYIYIFKSFLKMQKYCKIHKNNHNKFDNSSIFNKIIDNYKNINNSTYYRIHVKKSISIN